MLLPHSRFTRLHSYLFIWVGFLSQSKNALIFKSIEESMWPRVSPWFGWVSAVCVFPAFTLYTPWIRHQEIPVTLSGMWFMGLGSSMKHSVHHGFTMEGPTYPNVPVKVIQAALDLLSWSSLRTWPSQNATSLRPTNTMKTETQLPLTFTWGFVKGLDTSCLF